MEFDSFDSLMIYLLVAFISYMFIGLAHKAGKKSSFLKLVCYLIAIIIPTTMAAMRNNVGTDFENYNSRFNWLRFVSWNYAFTETRAEWGFIFLSKLIAGFACNSYIFGFYSFLTLAIIVKALDEQYPEWMHCSMYLIYLFAYFFFSFNLMRQNLALAITFYSMKYIDSKRFVPFIILIVIASLFHISAAIYIPAFFIYNIIDKRKSRWVEAGFALLSMLFALYFRNILRFLISFGIPFITKFTYLFNESTSAQNRDFFVKLLIAIVFVFLNIVMKDDIESHRIRKLIGFYYISVALSFAGFLNPFFKRIAFYYSISELELMAKLPYTQERKGGQLLIKGISIFGYIIIFVVIAYILKQHHIIPYRVY